MAGSQIRRTLRPESYESDTLTTRPLTPTVDKPGASMKLHNSLLNLACYVSLHKGLHTEADSLCSIVNADCSSMSVIVIKHVKPIPQLRFDYDTTIPRCIRLRQK